MATPRRVLVWIEPGTWEACVTAAADLVQRPGQDQVTLLYVPDDTADLVRGAHGALWGRRAPRVTPDSGGEALIADAVALLTRLAPGVSYTSEIGHGPVERVVTAASEHVDYLVLGRQGDQTRRGPSSLGKHTRFVIDHARCRVLVVWPGTAPSAATIPPLPPDDPRR